MDIRRYSALLLAVLAVCWYGCSSKPGSGKLQPQNGPSVSQSTSTAPFGDPKYQKLVDELSENNGDVNAVTRSSSMSKSIGDAFKKATSAVGSAFTFQPQVIPAADPVSLSSRPEKINVEVYFHAGRVSEQNGNLEHATKQYSRALDTEPDHLPTLISLARLHDRQGQFADAEKMYRRAIAADPKNAMAHNDLGFCLARQDRRQEALFELRTAAQLDANRKLYRNNLATVLVADGQINEAWRELHTVHPPAVAHFNLGFLLYHTGKKEEARQQFELAHAADARLTVARQMLEKLDAERRPQYDRMATRPVPRTSPANVPAPEQMRRTPPPVNPSVAPPAYRYQQPIPARPSSYPRDTSVMPQEVRSPIRPLSGYIMERGDPNMVLPTPGQLR